MNQQITVLIGVVVVILVFFVFVGIWATRFKKVGPNEVLIVSGRARQLPDGSRVGYRIVKGGGTFVFPIYEKADALSLEVMSVELTRSKVKTANGTAMLDCVTQVKLKSDDASLAAAMEHFLSKSQPQMKELVRPIIEKNLSAALATVTLSEIEADPAKYAARVQNALSDDLGKMGLAAVSFAIQNVRAA